MLSLYQKKIIIDSIPIDDLDCDKITEMEKEFPPILKKFITFATDNNIAFVISGSFASHIAGTITSGYGDLDVYINSELAQLEGFKVFAFDIAHILKVYQDYKVIIDTNARLNNLKHPTLLISRVVSACSAPDFKTVDFVLAPAAISISKLYSLYIINSFDISATRTAIFLDNARWKILQLIIPSFKFLRKNRKKKYEKRNFKFNPSSLSLLCLNVLLASKQISYYD